MPNISTEFNEEELKTSFIDDAKILKVEIEQESILDKLQPLKDGFVGNFGHPYCRECIKTYNETKGGHRIDCRGIPSGLDFVPKELRAGMSNEELTRSLIVSDPVRWLKVYFGWIARDYQEEYLWCTARRKVCRWSRRSGKCLHKDTLQYLADGSAMSAQELFNKYNESSYDCLSFDPINYKITTSKARIYDNGKRQILEIISSNGISTKITEEHPFYVYRSDWLAPEWVKAKDLHIGDSIAILGDCNSIDWGTVKCVNYVGVEQTYSVSVDKYHTLVNDGFITHNSEVVIADALHGLITQAGVPLIDGEKRGCKILLYTPYNDQVVNMFMKLEGFINRNDDILKMQKRYVKNPYFMQFTNGSWILGKPAGSKGGSGGASSRGWGADRYLVDEGDYLMDNDYATLLPMLTEHNQTRFVNISTPSGRRQKFWSFCHDIHYKEMHVPCYRRPDWNKQTEEEARSECPTELDYIHEFCLSGQTIVNTVDIHGVTPKRFYSLSKGDYLINKEGSKVKVVNHCCTGEKLLYSYYSTSGNINCTADHKIMGRNFEPIKISTAKELSFVYTKNYLFDQDKKKIFARLVGFLNGDGYVCKRGKYLFARFYGEKHNLEVIAKDLETVSGKVYKPYFKSKSIVETWCIEVGGSLVLDLIDYGAVIGKKTHVDWGTPEWIKDASDSIKLEFFGALYGAEGSTPIINKGYTAHSLCLGMYLKSPKILNDFCEFLEVYDIKAVVRSGSKKGYILYISGDENIYNFCKLNMVRYSYNKELFCFYLYHYGLYKRHWYNEKYKSYCATRNAAKDDSTNLIDMCNKYGLSLRKYNKWSKRNPNGVCCKYRKYNTVKNLYTVKEFVVNNCVDNVVFSKIIKQRKRGNTLVYNCEVASSDHNYLLANGCATYNCADFGSAESGVFKVDFIDLSLSDYAYYSDENQGDLPCYRFNPTWVYCLGVDLNEKYGIAICVLGWNPDEERWYVVDRDGVEKSEYTQIAGMNLVVKMNRIWNPKFIYMDKKPSTTSFEVLKKYGIQESQKKSGAINADSRLAYNIKQFDFGARIDGPDYTGKIVTRIVKPFMVGIATRKFEQDQIRFPRKDKLLYQQLVDYEYKATPAGNVIYVPSTQGDHFLDALMLGLLAFTMEYSELGRGRYSEGIAIGPSFGNKDNSQENGIIERAIHFVPSRSHTAYRNMRKDLLKPTRNVMERNRYAIKTNLRRNK